MNDLSNEEREEFIRLCQAAHAATVAGRNHDAHLYFREAIKIFPLSTNVWLWLAKVVDIEEDRRVALENVLAIDPNHKEARRRLAEINRRSP
ncbi:MAG: hypothetical protein K8L91_24835 [Anaerolineae bacterium]|nr:hypothetical protein [Anaerolineae bacterium]